jgi:hypothetical protein
MTTYKKLLQLYFKGYKDELYVSSTVMLQKIILSLELIK